VDADKTEYPDYHERCLELLRPGGVIAFDNTLRDGRVAEADPESESVRATKRFNESLHTDERVHLSFLPLADGVTLAMKK
jgi:predicted O-methyltransferase YrrM